MFTDDLNFIVIMGTCMYMQMNCMFGGLEGREGRSCESWEMGVY